MKVLVIGRTGQVARAVARRAHGRALTVEALGRPRFDVEHFDATAIISRRPDVVINAAAYTKVDKAESDRERAYRINAVGAGLVARAAAEAGAAMIHVSTDYVFAGDKTGAYVETDRTGPVNVYGASKLDGEARVRSAHAGAVIVRTAWVFDPTGDNFVRTILRLAKTRDEISVVNDQRGSPTFADDLADALLAIAHSKGRHPGVYHCAGSGKTTRANLARAVFELSAALGGPAARVVPASSADHPTPARRPANSRLDCSKLASDYGVRLRPWTEGLRACLEEVAADGWSVE